jgi:triosephosphate isomerase
MTKVQEFIATEFKGLNRGFVATPESREALEAFARANQGSMDMVLMQMAIQYGASCAYENVQELLGNK